MHDLRPCLIQRLIPDTGGEILLDLHFLPLSHLLDLPHLLLDLLVPLLKRHLVDFMDQHKDNGVLAVLLNALQGEFPVLKTFLEPLSMILDLKDVDEHLDTSEDGLLLHEEVLLHEGILSSAIPKVQGQSAHELELVLLPLHGVAYLLGVLGGEVGEDHRVHGGLSRTRVAH